MKVSETFWLTIISQFQHAFVFISVVLFFLIPKEGRRQYAEFGWILVLSLICESTGWIGIFVFHANMNLGPSILTLVYFPLFIMLYLKQDYWRNWRLVAYFSIVCISIFGLINLFFIQGVWSINSYTRAIQSFFFIIIGIAYLFGYSAELPKKIRVRHPMYWISIAFVFYNSVALYITLWMDYLVNVRNSRLIGVYMIHNTVGALHYVIFWYALTLIRREHEKTR